MNAKTLKSRCFRIKDGYKYFEYNIDGIREFKGDMEELIKDIKNSSQMYKMLNTMSWRERGAYGISRPNLLKRDPNHEIFKILDKFRK